MAKHEGRTRLDEESRELWRELDSFTRKENWCCKVMKETGLEGLMCETHDYRFHRIRLNYCPHCGRKFRK